MKKSFLVIVALLMFIGTAGAQKIGYINTESILSEIPAYTAAQSQLEALSDKYKAQIETELGKIETLYQNYQASRNSMSASQRQNAENEIISKERVVQEKQRIYFGEDGIMAKKAEELLAPIRARVDKAIADVARMGGYDLVIDLAAVQGVVYKNEALDLTQFVLVKYNENL
ncbi:MAG: OmpH family outer membrane protein [Bacteroidales bacterium]|jgi:outer membrane protein|nr:OmpH family outer membrane protein [Bacteroidales bacterium]MBQ1637464.1 OmpH family outer membrane protein [Bacteroidales bacterium]MBQ1679888.1 OmpH family outer membrane protein [Bacteroidales bacterium]MBQ1754326.1 OmpH family outer membrane protein [Bacteroidales bacterium]MBQ1832127.1 OmpH family outer membrane protein [Bacteroidales bacterium]